MLTLLSLHILMSTLASRLVQKKTICRAKVVWMSNAQHQQPFQGFHFAIALVWTHRLNVVVGAYLPVLFYPRGIQVTFSETTV